MKAKDESHDDTKIASAPANSPEQLRLAGLAHVSNAPVRQANLRRKQAVDRQAQAPAQPPHPAAQRQTARAGVADHAPPAPPARGAPSLDRHRPAAPRRRSQRRASPRRPPPGSAVTGPARCRHHRSKSPGSCARRTALPAGTPRLPRPRSSVAHRPRSAPARSPQATGRSSHSTPAATARTHCHGSRPAHRQAPAREP
jgi:hypothetical protein